MKKVLVCIAIAAISYSASAQNDSTSQEVPYQSNKPSGSNYGKTSFWTIAINPSMPIGHFNTYSGFGLGGYLGWEYKTSGSFGITLNAGYIDYFGKNTNGIKYSDFNYIPLLAGVKFYFGGGNFYLHPEAGAGFGTSGLGTSFWYGAGLGDRLSKTIDLELKYVGWHQNLISNGSGGSTYGNTGGSGGNGGGTGGGGYGGHYSTIDLKLAFTL
ncbi:MAG TPA: hypothetical protein VN726_07605 [Hanamia sp.]|nr:hypothetical protein [Hanamia sp.]